MVIFDEKWKKYNEIQLTKNKMYLNIRKMTNHPPSPEVYNHKAINIDIKADTSRPSLSAHIKRCHRVETCWLLIFLDLL